MNLLKSFSIYTFATFFNRGMGLLMAPIISFYISQDDNGVLSLLNTFVVLGAGIMGLGTKGVLTVKYFHLEKTVFKKYFSAILIGPVALFVVLMVLLALFERPLAKFVDIPAYWIYYIGVVSLGQVINELCLGLFRVEDNAKFFAFFNVGLAILNFGLSIGIIVGLGLTWEGRALGILISVILFAVVSFFIFQRRHLMTLRIQKAHVTDALAFGVPLIPHVIGSFAIEYSDKLFLQGMVGQAELGVYDMGYKIGMSIQILVTSFALGFVPYLFSHLKQLTQEKRVEIVRISYLFLAGVLVAVFILGAVSPYIFHWFFDQKFYGGHLYVFWIALGYFFFGCYAMFANYIHYSGKTYIFSILAVVNVGVNLALNYFLIKAYGAIGAAYATIFSFFLVFVITAVIANKLYPMPWFRKEVFDLRDIIKSIHSR